MYDIRSLEEEWERYHKKKRRPWYILATVVFLLLVVSIAFLKYKKDDFFTFNYEKIDFFQFNEANEHETEVSRTGYSEEKKEGTDGSSIVLIDNALTELATKKNAVSKNIAISSSQTKLRVDVPPAETLDELPIPEDIVPIDEPEVNTESGRKPRKKINLNIIETSAVSAYEDVARRFYQSHDPDDSLFLAQSYYRKGNYDKAEYWALQTNKYNESIEESWLIFAKSKVKLGRKNEAIRILTIYIRKSNSAAAKKLLHKIKQGTL